MISIHQNLFLAIVLSIVGGLTQVFCVFVVAYPLHCKNVLKRPIHPRLQKLVIPSSVLFQFINGLVILLSAVLGPVAIVVPVRIGANLLSNMLIFGYLTKMEDFDKSARVGTYMVGLAALMVSIVGPTIQEQGAVLDLIRYNPWAMTWSVVLVITCLVTTIINSFYIRRGRIKDQRLVFGNLLATNISGATMAYSVAKLVNSVTQWWQYVPIMVLLFLSFYSVAQSSILQAGRVNQKLFVPSLACGNQVLNSITGLLIWQDWKVIQSWPGYASVMVQFLLGVYLISAWGDYDLNQQQGREEPDSGSTNFPSTDDDKSSNGSCSKSAVNSVMKAIDNPNSNEKEEYEEESHHDFSV